LKKFYPNLHLSRTFASSEEIKKATLKGGHYFI
jgi:hypothetical protein